VRNSILISFWIKDPDPSGPFGYGVTAFSITDAFEIVSRAGYRLPDDKSSLKISKDIKPADLDHHILDNMGPIVVRGLWYPFIGIGAGTSN
jgi:hypothetical protein